LSYLEAGNRFAKIVDHGAAINAYQSALIASEDLLASPYEIAVIRKNGYGGLAEQYEKMDQKQPNTSSLYNLARSLNEAYLNDVSSIEEKTDYYNKINELSKILFDAEVKANEIESTKRGANFTAVFSGVLAATSAATGNSAQAQSYMNTGKTEVESSRRAVRAMDKSLSDKFEGFGKDMDVKSFTYDDGTEYKNGKPFMPGEVFYHLMRHPNLVKSNLETFAADKPQLRNLLVDFYKTGDKKAITPIFEYFTKYEALILNYECRGYDVPEKEKINLF
jgi:hypothetical protein